MSIRAKCVCAASLVFAMLAAATDASAQRQWPPRGKLRVGPLVPDVQTMPAIAAPGPEDIAGRPIWLLPLGTTIRFRDDRLILPTTSKYQLGTGATMGNQFMYLAPSGQERTISAETTFVLRQIGPVYGKKIYPADLRQPQNRIYMELVSDDGLIMQWAITPGSEVTPSVGQFAEFFDLEVPESLPPE